VFVLLPTLFLMLLGSTAGSHTPVSVPTATHRPTPTASAAPTPASPEIVITADKTTGFTITAKNPGPGACPTLRLQVGGSTDPRDDPALDVRLGAIMPPKEYVFTNVADGASVTVHLTIAEARELPENPAADSYNPNTGHLAVGAAGYCDA
jgi:hypothetical protein